MKFEVGKTYTNGSREIRIVGEAETYGFGDCLIGEELDGTLIPVGKGGVNTIGYKACCGWEDRIGDMEPTIYRKRFIKYLTDRGVAVGIAEGEVDSWMDGCVLGNPEGDAAEAASNWD